MESIEAKRKALKITADSQDQDVISILSQVEGDTVRNVSHEDLDMEDVQTNLEEVAEAEPDQIILQLERPRGSGGYRVLKKEVIDMNNKTELSGPATGADHPSDSRLKMLQEDLDREREKRKKAEEKADDLKEKNHELRIENATKDRENQLEVQAKEAEQKDGLSGITDDPETKQALLGMLERVLTSNGQQQQQLASPSQEPEPDAENLSASKQEALQTVRSSLSSYDDMTAAKLAQLVQRPDLIAKAYDKAAGNSQQQNGQTETANNQTAGV